MLAIRRSGEIQTRKDDSCRGRTIKSLSGQITTNQRQYSSLCFRHTLPYQNQHNEVRIGVGPDHDQAKGHHLQRKACPQERVPTWTTRFLELQMRSSTRRRSNPQKRQNPHPKATKGASTRCSPSCTPRRNESTFCSEEKRYSGQGSTMYTTIPSWVLQQKGRSNWQATSARQRTCVRVQHPHKEMGQR